MQHNIYEDFIPIIKALKLMKIQEVSLRNHCIQILLIFELYEKNSTEISRCFKNFVRWEQHSVSNGILCSPKIAAVQDICLKTHISYAKAMVTNKSVICELEIYTFSEICVQVEITTDPLYFLK